MTAFRDNGEVRAWDALGEESAVFRRHQKIKVAGEHK